MIEPRDAVRASLCVKITPISTE